MEQDDLVREFLIESYENLDQLDRALVELEQDPHDRENLASIFRTIHTIKGSCGFFGFSKLEAVSHVGENLLSRLRDGNLVLDADITSGLLAMVDAIRGMLANIESTRGEGDGDYTALIARLTQLNTGRSGSPAPKAVVAPPAASAPPPPPAPAAAVAPAPPLVAAPAESGLSLVFDPEVDAVAGEIERPDARADERRPDERRGGDDRRQGVTDSSLRIDVGLLDKLMNLVGELVLARNQILQFTATQSDSSFIGATQRLNLVTSELQEGVMKTRMQPIGNVWSKFPRIVRDLATTCHKRVRIEMYGKETDLDKTIIEAIKDPLTHIVRNSVDHGIESPELRMQRGKNPEGAITLRAFHEGGQINIEIADDGAGIDPEKVRRKAVQRGVITGEQGARMSDHEVLKLIFMPGFSTAEQITNVSGRGVGMDVVKTNIEKIGGTVDVQSKLGEGTTLRIKIPLTLAIIPALMVTTGGERFAIAQVNLVELVRLEGDQVKTGVERIGGATLHRLRGNLLPLVYLNRELGLPSRGSDDVLNIVVLKADDRQFGLVVDAINDTEEIVVKPLGKQLKRVNVFAGATIMGDGRVALILDVLGIGQQASVVTEMRDGRLRAELAKTGPVEATDLKTLLLFRIAANERMALPLSMVARLEEFPESAIERSGDLEVVQYRGEILPLVSLPRYFKGAKASEADPRQVIVFTERERSVGLVVDRILDIVNESMTVSRRAARRGVLGSAVIQQRVTDLLDVHAVIRDSDPSFLSDTAA